MAIAAALEAAASIYSSNDNKDPARITNALKPFIVRRVYEKNMFNASEAANKLKVSRTTIYDWVDRKILLGWRATKRGLTIPAAQILGPGKVVPGIDQILKIIDDPELTWAFLSAPWPFAEAIEIPLDKLKSGAIDDVINAAPSFGTAVT